MLETWDEEVGHYVAAETDPVAALLTLARPTRRALPP